MKDSYIAYNVQDNWLKYDYSNRYLDAIAAVFHIQSASTAAIEIQNNIFLSYSNDIDIVPNIQKTIDFIKDSIGDTPDNLLGIYLIYNLDFRALLKLSIRFVVDPDCKNELNTFLKNIDAISNSFDKCLKKKGIPTPEKLEKLDKIVSDYKNILSSYSNELSEYLDKFFRPAQDAYKLHYYLNQNPVTKFQILPNIGAIHADTNIAFSFPNNMGLLEEKKYIGVSRLCCGYCHTYLDQNMYEHRGTHGVCDDKWGFPWLRKGEVSPLEAKFKEDLIIQKVEEFNPQDPPPQHRKLSIDLFEKHISYSKDKSLFSVKHDILEHQYTYNELFPAYIFFQGKTVPCDYPSTDNDFFAYDSFASTCIGQEKVWYSNIGYFSD